MKKYIQLLDGKKRPFQAELIPCDNRFGITTCFEQQSREIKKTPKHRAKYMQMMFGKDPTHVVPILSPCEI